MRCKTQDNYDSFKTLQSNRSQQFRQHKSSKSEDIDLLLFQNMNYSSVHEISLNNDQNELIKKQEEYIKKLEHQNKILQNFIINQSHLQQLCTFVEQVFIEVELGNQQNIFEPKLQTQCLKILCEQKQQLKEQNKFINCLKDLVILCSPPEQFSNGEQPNLKQIWRCIKQMLQECREKKKINQEQQQFILQLTRGIQKNQLNKPILSTLGKKK